MVHYNLVVAMISYSNEDFIEADMLSKSIISLFLVSIKFDNILHGNDFQDATGSDTTALNT